MVHNDLDIHNNICLLYILYQDGSITYEEVEALNISKDDFNSLDMNEDGFVKPPEFDESLK